MLFERLVRPTLYRLGRRDPEVVHHRTLNALVKIGRSPAILAALRRRYALEATATVFGLRFPNPVGLAAGMDKDGVAVGAWASLGFGFVELGTVTRHPQPGNPRPRLFQLPRSGALINRMGFNNEGAQALADRIAGLGERRVPLGVSIGKSRATAVPDAIDDYLFSLRTLYPHADYFAVNVSSPNTPGLRALQDRGALTELLAALRASSTELAAQHARPRVPLLVKLAPDLDDAAIAELLEVCADYEVAGVIATNTTLSRDGLHAAEAAVGDQEGGLSGSPLAHRSRQVVSFIHDQTQGKLPIIGVGGIAGPDDALRMLDAGASLLQLYTGFIYSGPALIRKIVKACATR